MRITVLFFAGQRDQVGQPQLTLDVGEGSSVADLITALQSRLPHIRMDGVRVAVDESFVPTSHVLSAGETVAFIPPVSGG